MKTKLLRAYIRENITGDLQSHTIEPSLGDVVTNVNPGCKHYGSQGNVLDIVSLPADVGKVIVYQVTNSGDSYSPGDVLEKTMDQLSATSLSTVAEVRRFINQVIVLHTHATPAQKRNL
jgi:hypothetical protein